MPWMAWKSKRFRHDYDTSSFHTLELHDFPRKAPKALIHA